MSGCGTSLKGRAIVEVYENGMNVQDYDHWVKNYISVHRSVAEGAIKPEFANWPEVQFYIKMAGGLDLDPVELRREELPDGTVKVTWWHWDHYEDDEVPYTIKSEPLAFEYDPYEGLERFTLTAVRRESADDPIPDSWNGTLMFSKECPLWGRPAAPGMWDWFDSHTIEVKVSGDLLVTPFGEDPGVVDPIATREIAVRRAA
ncbi:hypothetical protein ACTMTF_15185 [Nonomuraea sp. ZG12]|uniref:hypothetical protein n=1 Tax=Nonomuraea sp. ZG12 TaxID=3452207 RepID=UPI003F89FBA5